MMHWRAEPVPSPTPARSRGPMRPEATGRPLMVRALGLAVAALLTANFVIVAEQASGRDLITLGHDGLSNAREAIAKLLEDNKDKGQEPQVAGAVLEQSTTTTALAAPPHGRKITVLRAVLTTAAACTLNLLTILRTGVSYAAFG